MALGEGLTSAVVAGRGSLSDWPQLERTGVSSGLRVWYTVQDVHIGCSIGSTVYLGLSAGTILQRHIREQRMCTEALF